MKDEKRLEALVEQYHKDLPERIREWLKEERGLSDEIITKFKLGWNGKAITIPITNSEGQYSFFKYRKDPEDISDNSKYWCDKDASAELYGREHIANPPSSLIICEGELDRLILETNQLPAITSTGGAGTFKDEWIEQLSKLSSQLFICWDNDATGCKYAQPLAEKLPKARVVGIPILDGIKDVTDLIQRQGIEEFRKLLQTARTFKEITDESRLLELAMSQDTGKEKFRPLSSKELIEILGLTIKKDETNKLLTFLGELSAYTETCQFNISFNAPSSTGKSYIPIEIDSLFPPEDVCEIGYCSATAFFHDHGEYIKEQKGYFVDLSRKILIFLDQPHTLLLQHLRPLLSHDKKEIVLKITDKSQKYGLKTKNIILKGFPAVIFCTGNLRIDEQEATRFLLLSPETNQEKIREAIYEKIKKETDAEAYKLALENLSERQLLKERIKAIREAHITDIKIASPQKVNDIFFKKNTILKPRHMRDISRITSFIKAFALLNFWHRELDGSSIIANDGDIDEAFRIWDMVSESQEFNLPPYVYNLFREVILPVCQAGRGVTRREIIQKHFEVYGRFLPDWQLRQQIIPMLETAGLIIQEPDPEDKRKMLIFLTTKDGELDSGEN